MNLSLPRFSLAAIAALLGFTAMTAQVRPPSTSLVGYSPGLTKVEGNQPLTTTVNLAITSPNNLPAGSSVTITPQLILLGAPEGVSVSEALSFVTLTPPTLTFTGPNQTLTTVVEGVFPVGVAAGDYSYQIKTPGWGVDAQDQGAFLNATIYPLPTPGGPPTVQITTPLDNASFVYQPLVGPLQVPFQFTSSAPTVSPIEAIDSDMNGGAVTLSTVNNGDGSFTSTSTLNVTAPGIYTLRARASNAEGTSSDDVTFSVSVSAPPPTVAIGSPTLGSSFTIPSSGTLTVPYTFTGRSSYGGVTGLTATLNGQNVVFTASGMNTATAAGSGNFLITTSGNYELVVTATDMNGSATARTSFTVRAAVPVPPPTVSIAAPMNGATYTRVAGSPATLIPFSYSGNAGTGYTLTSLTGTLNGAPLTAAVTGLGSEIATGTGNLSISSPGSYTLSANAASAGGTASTSVTFTVTETQPPSPGCGVNWLPPISLCKTQQGGQIVAVKFELDCGCEHGIDRTGDGDPDFYPGQRTKSKYRIDKSVVIAISEIFPNGSASQPQLFSYGQYTIQGNDMYHLNFLTARGKHRYRIELVSTANGVPQVLATREFYTK